MPRPSLQRARPAAREPAKRPGAPLGRENDAEPLRVVKTKGSFVHTADGRRYLDLYMGWCVGNLGWGRKEILDRLRRFDGPDYVPPIYQYAPWDDLASRLVRLAPGRMGRCFRATGGTEAVEIALQAALAFTKRRKVLSLEGSYHGNSFLTNAVGSRDKALRHAFPKGNPRLKPPLDEAALGRVEKALRGGEVAAVILEPILLPHAVQSPTEEFMMGLASLCREHGTLLVMDEVATGMGRTGKLFATEHYKVEPDIVCLAKGLTGGYGAMGATLMTDEVASGIEGEFGFYSTYGWHPRSVEAALAVLDVFRENEATLLESVEARGRQFEERLRAMDLGKDAKVRAKGLAVAAELEDGERVGKIVEKCRKNGRLVTSSGNVLLMFPALDIDERTAARGLRLLKKSL